MAKEGWKGDCLQESREGKMPIAKLGNLLQQLCVPDPWMWFQREWDVKPLSFQEFSECLVTSSLSYWEVTETHAMFFEGMLGLVRRTSKTQLERQAGCP